MLERVWRKGNPLTLLVGVQTSTATMGKVWRFSKKLEIELPYDPAIPLLGIHTAETRIERDTCTPMLITALFTKPEHGSNLDVHWQTNGSESCGTYSQWNITQPLKGTHLSQF